MQKTVDRLLTELQADYGEECELIRFSIAERGPYFVVRAGFALRRDHVWQTSIFTVPPILMGTEFERARFIATAFCQLRQQIDRAVESVDAAKLIPYE